MIEKEEVEEMEEEEENEGGKEILRRKNYHYTYLQITASQKEKDRVLEHAQKENFRTVSDFLQRIVFDYIRKKENPEMFLSPNDSDINSLVLERIHKSIGEVLKNQDYLIQREDIIEDLREMVTSLFKKSEAEALAKEREIIVSLLEKHTSLSLRQIQEDTGFLEDIVFKIISDMSLFKITQSGRFALR